MTSLSRRTPRRMIGDAPGESGGPRLWRALAHPFVRESPSRGLDVLGERVVGWAHRRRASKLDHARARAIAEEAGRLRDLGEAALNARIEEVRSRVAVAATDRRAMDAGFAVAYEVVRREIGFSLHHVQVLAALVIADGCCAELATGEGKTVTAILPATVEAWRGRGVHVVTVNDYLARRDAATTGPAYRRLGLSVGVLQDSTEHEERILAYSSGVTYGADKQFIFDHLRDRLVTPLASSLAGALLDELASRPGRASAWTRRVVQRELNCAIVDEADSVLIDEAVTPAIIAHETEESGDQAGYYAVAAGVARGLRLDEDYVADHRLRHVHLTERGREAVGAQAKSLPPFWSGPRRREELVTQALTAKEFFTLGDDYIIKDGQVVIVDRSTGRVLPGRQWQLGVHQAVEAKEGLAITDARRTSARVSYQQFFRRYAKLSGMTGTAAEVSHELWTWYRLPVVRVPTNKPVIRVQAEDRAFRTESAKFDAVADRVADLHREGRPVLVGTRSVAASERLGERLAARGLTCSILNATREAEEAAIIARAGERGAITVATNMAGRGTDISLGKGVRELGGLVVLATERHEEARVDRQLFGRSGRQGDPGRAEAFVSLEDQLVVMHAPRVLRWAAGRSVGGVPGWLRWAIWGASQWAAGRKAAVLRMQMVLADSWMDMALHHRSR